jgi:hypothetical protein
MQTLLGVIDLAKNKKVLYSALNTSISNTTSYKNIYDTTFRIKHITSNKNQVDLFTEGSYKGYL